MILSDESLYLHVASLNNTLKLIVIQLTQHLVFWMVKHQLAFVEVLFRNGYKIMKVLLWSLIRGYIIAYAADVYLYSRYTHIHCTFNVLR